MARRDLSRLLRPRSIVAVGGEWAANVVEQCRRMKYRGKLWAVNPRRKKLFDAKCFGNLRELPAPPDAVFLGVNREATVEAVAELAAMGGGGAVCFASGFAEADGRDLQNKLVAAAGRMPVLGPNCYGLINFLDGAPLWPDQHGGMRVTSGAAIVAQSSNILINLSSQRRGLPLAYLAAAGNQAQTSAADIARGFLADKRVRAVGFYLEGIVDAADFADMAAQAESQNIPLVALKAGKCPQSAAAAKTHTDAITGGGAASSAFLRRCNIAEAETLDEMLEMLKLLQTAGRLRGRRIMSLSCSGGEAGHIADLAAERRLCFPPPPPKPKAKLQAVLGKRVTIANPLDYHTYIWRDPAALYAAYRAAFDCGAGFDNSDLRLSARRPLRLARVARANEGVYARRRRQRSSGGGGGDFGRKHARRHRRRIVETKHRPALRPARIAGRNGGRRRFLQKQSRPLASFAAAFF